MEKRPNVLWLMSDQHNANCTSYRNHPNVKTPNLDRIVKNGVDFSNAYANNPICSPSRICFITGQYVHTHGMYGNTHTEFAIPNHDTIACQFRRYGYQTALFGKSHMVRRWDEDGFEIIRYTDLCDARYGVPTTTHYFDYLNKKGLSDYYEEGSPKPGQEYTMDGSAPAELPYENSIEKYTGDETLKFLDNRDESRPFFIHMSFQRPHAPIAPAKEHFDMYDPDKMVLPENAYDYFENSFEGKPKFMQKKLEQGSAYPLADPDPKRLKRCLASYYALISVIDGEIGRVLDMLEEKGELDNTIIFYTADHGDFAGEHGLFHKNFGIYDSIQKVPFLLSWPKGLKDKRCDALVESVDLYPTLCEICDIPMPEGRDGKSVISAAKGEEEGKEAAYCEWEWLGGKVTAIRTKQYRLVYYGGMNEGELYDHNKDTGETDNLWYKPEYAEIKMELLGKLLTFTLKYAVITNGKSDHIVLQESKYMPTQLLHKHRRYWSGLKNAYEEKIVWPPDVKID